MGCCNIEAVILVYKVSIEHLLFMERQKFVLVSICRELIGSSVDSCAHGYGTSDWCWQEVCLPARFFFFFFFPSVLGSTAPCHGHLLEVVPRNILVLQYGLCINSLPDPCEQSVLYYVWSLRWHREYFMLHLLHSDFIWIQGCPRTILINLLIAPFVFVLLFLAKYFS